MRFLLRLILILVAAAVAVYVAAGRADGPVIEIVQPAGLVGQSGSLDVTIDAPRGRLDSLTVVLEQNGKQVPLYALDNPGTAVMKQESAERIRVTRPIGKASLPELQAGDARVIVQASRPVLYGVRRAETTAVKDFKVRLDPPRVAVISTHHYINFGGSEMVVYRATPDDVESGVQVGELTYPGFPASGVRLPGITLKDPALRVAFFALLHDQDLNTPIFLYARDPAGNTARGEFDHRVFPKVYRKSNIDLAESLLQRVVPAILERSPDFKARAAGTLLEQFLAINGEMRRLNAEKIAGLAPQTSPQLDWEGPFTQLRDSQVEAGFADHRTYFYEKKEVDQQVHLGFDLATTANSPIVASNRGKVLHADDLGIYGNCVVLDHGMGVQSLYAHLSAIEVKVGDTVGKGQVLGRSGMTGLAGGDHLHFSMLVNGRPVNPVEWWDPHWIEDRLMRKLRTAGGS
jgi:murein DD-endopeptidase MepM/ murein hydrolase activator NlpD